MQTSRSIVWAVLAGTMVLSASMVSGQNYPNKPIRIITSPTGGSVDFAARLIAQGISGPLGQPVIVENRPSGVIQGETVAKAPPDGYTVFLTGSIFWIEPLLQKVPYDPMRDFSPISLTGRSPNIIVVHPSLPVKSVKELIALAKAKPGELNYASSATGGSSHLAGELFKAMAGVNIVRIAYKGGGPALIDLIAGYVQIGFATATSVTPHLGRLRALAVTSLQPSELFPKLPTVAASGLLGYEATTVYAIFAPAKTPETIIKRLNQEIVRVLNRAEVKEKFFNAGVEIVGSSPEQLVAAMKSEMVIIGKLIKDAGIREE